MNVAVSISKGLDCMNTDTSSMSLTMPQKLSGIAETASTPKALVPNESLYVNVIIR